MSKITSWILFGLALSLCVITVLGKHGLVELYQLTRESRLLETKNLELESEIIELRNTKFALEHSDVELEKHAREELGLSKPGEIIYIFPQTNEE